MTFMYLWWTSSTFGGVHVPLVEFMHLVLTRMPGASLCRRFRSMLLFPLLHVSRLSNAVKSPRLLIENADSVLNNVLHRS